MSGKGFVIENTAAYQRGVSDYWEAEAKKWRLRAAEIALVELRLRDMDELLEQIHDRLVKAGHHDCEHCIGTGGVAEAYDVPSKDGFEISHTETICWSAPSDDECEQCHGTGIEFK